MAGFTQKLTGLELNSPGQLYGSWLADRSIPGAERRVRGAAYIGVKGRIASEVLTLVIDKVMGVERIEEIRADLEGHPFSDLRALGQGKVQILEVGPANIADPAPVARIARCVEVTVRLEGIDIEQRAFEGIKVIWVLQEWIHSRDQPRYAGSNVRLADPVIAEKEWDAAREAINWAELPPPHNLVQRSVRIQERFAVAEGKIIDKGGRHDLRHVVGRQSPGATALVGRDDTTRTRPREGLGLRV